MHKKTDWHQFINSHSEASKELSGRSKGGGRVKEKNSQKEEKPARQEKQNRAILFAQGLDPPFELGQRS